MSTRDELVEYWLKAAEVDLPVIDHLFEKGDYHYALFFAHLVVEKTLKAIYVQKVDVDVPYKHRLPLLANLCGLKLSEEQLDLLERVSRFNIEARYPDKKFQFYKLCTKEFTQEYLKKIRELRQWLLSQMTS